MALSSNLLPEFHMFHFLSRIGKNLCDIRVSEVEEDIEEIAASFQSESKDEVKQRMKIEYLSGLIKKFRLQKEYIKIVSHEISPYKVAYVNFRMKKVAQRFS
jgi:hypothetical protein